MKKRQTNFALIKEWAKDFSRPATKLAYEAGISEALARGLISGKYQSLPLDHYRRTISKTIGVDEELLFPWVEDVAS